MAPRASVNPRAIAAPFPSFTVSATSRRRGSSRRTPSTRAAVASVLPSSTTMISHVPLLRERWRRRRTSRASISRASLYAGRTTVRSTADSLIPSPCDDEGGGAVRVRDCPAGRDPRPRSLLRLQKKERGRAPRQDPAAVEHRLIEKVLRRAESTALVLLRREGEEVEPLHVGEVLAAGDVDAVVRGGQGFDLRVRFLQSVLPRRRRRDGVDDEVMIQVGGRGSGGRDRHPAKQHPPPLPRGIQQASLPEQGRDSQPLEGVDRREGPDGPHGVGRAGGECGGKRRDGEPPEKERVALPPPHRRGGDPGDQEEQIVRMEGAEPADRMP